MSDPLPAGRVARDRDMPGARRPCTGGEERRRTGAVGNTWPARSANQRPGRGQRTVCANEGDTGPIGNRELHVSRGPGRCSRRRELPSPPRAAARTHRRGRGTLRLRRCRRCACRRATRPALPGSRSTRGGVSCMRRARDVDPVVTLERDRRSRRATRPGGRSRSWPRACPRPTDPCSARRASSGRRAAPHPAATRARTPPSGAT